MGFHFEPAIVWPHTAFRWPAHDDLFSDDPKPRVPHELGVWRPHESLRLGHTTRVEKLDVPHIAESIGPHERAVICFSSVIVHGVFDRIDQICSGQGHPDDLLAPPFLRYVRGDPRSEEEALDSTRVWHPTATSVIDVGPRNIGSREPGEEPFRWPDGATMGEHNRLLNQDIDTIVDRLRTYHFILHPPLLWVSMRDVNEWFDRAAENKAPQWRHMRAHQDAEAQYQAWRSWIRALSTTRARMLLVFPPY